MPAIAKDSSAPRAAFAALCQQLQLTPRAPWTGGAVDYEWDHLRLMLEVLPLDLSGKRALEFGCNAGASAILLSHLGAAVSAVDVSAAWVSLARQNAARYGIERIDFQHVPDARALPFANARFDLIACNSVLEHVGAAERAAVQRELDRVLAPGGLILLTGSSNRLWPREARSGRWFVNYLPHALDRLWRRPPRRGLWPWRARHGFGAHYVNLDDAGPDGLFARSRQGMAMPPARLRLHLWLAARLGVGPGLLAQNMSCLLQKSMAARLPD